MLEKLPAAVGHVLRRARPGLETIVFHQIPSPGGAPLEVSSAAFDDWGPLSPRHTADGEGLSPPLRWRGVPAATSSIVVLIEDADSPTPHPLVHAIAWNLPGVDGGLAEGALRDERGEPLVPDCGLNSYLQARYLPPDPPPGHGPHRYAFEVFALDRSPRFRGTPGRGQIVDALQGHVLADGCLIGVYERP
jgi:Raf kinase inhibitor-like YbhB/YbcL family protein